MKLKHIFAKKTTEKIKHISQYFLSFGQTSTRNNSLMNWSTHNTPSSLTLHASLASEHITSPQVSLSNRDSLERSKAEHFSLFILNYNNNQLSIATS